jgi:hypothetical protein
MLQGIPRHLVFPACTRPPGRVAPQVPAVSSGAPVSRCLPVGRRRRARTALGPSALGSTPCTGSMQRVDRPKAWRAEANHSQGRPPCRGGRGGSPRRGRGRTAGSPPSRHSAQHSGGGRPTHRLGDPPPLGKPQSPRGATSGRFPRPGQLSAILPRASDGAAVALSAPPRLSALGTRLGAGRLPRVLVPRSPPAPFMHPASGPSGTASPRRLLWPPVFAAPQRN